MATLSLAWLAKQFGAMILAVPVDPKTVILRLIIGFYFLVVPTYGNLFVAIYQKAMDEHLAGDH